MAIDCKNSWCNKYTGKPCEIPMVKQKCPFQRMKMYKAIQECAEKVRTLQKQYFRTRTHSDLEASKKAEYELDVLIMKFHNPYEVVQEDLL